MEFVEGGRATTFENGAIYWWPDTGAIELGAIALRYRGLMCVEEMTNDQGSGSDEPYVYVTVGAPDGGHRTVQGGVYQGVDSGASRPDDILVYHGPTVGLALSITLMEEDFGGPDAYRAEIETATAKAFDGLSRGVQFVPLFGPLLSAGIDAVREDLEREAARIAMDVLDLQDDHLGTQVAVLSPKELITATRRPKQEYKGLVFTHQTGDFRAGGAHYRVYWDVSAAPKL